MPFNELISVSWKINETTPIYLLGKIKERMDLRHKKVALLGMAFKPEIDDTRNSLSFKIKKALERAHAIIKCHDPFVEEFKGSVEEVLREADLVIVAMNHSEYKNLDLNKLRKLTAKNCLVCDVWNVFGKNKVIFSLSE